MTIELQQDHVGPDGTIYKKGTTLYCDGAFEAEGITPIPPATVATPTPKPAAKPAADERTALAP